MGGSIVEYYERNSTGATDIDLVSNDRKPGCDLTIQTISFVDETSPTTQVRVGIGRAGVIVWLKSFEGVTNGYVRAWDVPLTVPSEYRVIVRFTGSAAGDHLKAALVGYLSG